jgi:hypothetical protein
MNGNSKIKMLQNLIDLRKWLADTNPESAQADWYRAEIAKLTKRIYG